ncbi:glycogen debranching N-terminal domain-containing protein [Sinomonas halotolerans]|uniref:Glycogen debranching N-terminal domain-containing protein n=1 Tax=Sinomonas halotolerans TaxID=1644133 RepID=A0ABU9X054_9MICC
MTSEHAAPLQPALHRQHVALAAPTQIWLDADGRLAPQPGGQQPNTHHGARTAQPGGVTGAFHGDTRFLSRAIVTVDGAEPQPVGVAGRGSRLVVDGLARTIPGPTLDPAVRVRQHWSVEPGRIRHRIDLSTSLEHLDCALTVRLEADFAPMDAVRVGRGGEVATPRADDDGALVWEDGPRRAVVRTVGGTGRAVSEADDDADDTDGFPTEHAALSWAVSVRRGEVFRAEWTIELEDDAAIVRPAPDAGVAAEARHDPAGLLLARSLEELAGLRLAMAAVPDAPFVAAGAPWYFTLFGRDSLWAARLLLPLDTALAAGTLRALAAYQGERTDEAGAEEPGKIPHEVRAAELVLDGGPGGDQLRLPPVYYGSVDATGLWLCLLGELWRTGRAPDTVRGLLPHARRAADWLLAAGWDGERARFLTYFDASGHGLSNQGWKDSADALQSLDGRRAEGPIALAEAQAYAYEAAVSTAALFDELGEPGADQLHAFASDLRAKFRAEFWVADADQLEVGLEEAPDADSPGGADGGPAAGGGGPRSRAARFPAMALDGEGTPLDSPGSNMGHLLGTGLLEPEESAAVVAHLTGPELFSGFGIRTLSTAAAGYWPLSYHCGSVWSHDTAIAVRGMLAEGFRAEAAAVARGLVRASESFGHSLPELFSGEGTEETDHALPYPSSCRPQAWSAAAAVVVAQALGTR